VSTVRQRSNEQDRITGTQFARASAMISLTVNGERRRFESPLTAAQLIASLELTGKRVALERNGEIVPRGQFDQQPLSDGDRIEIVIAVGGG
jgi:sulfur carrier protein